MAMTQNDMMLEVQHVPDFDYSGLSAEVVAEVQVFTIRYRSSERMTIEGILGMAEQVTAGYKALAGQGSRAGKYEEWVESLGLSQPTARRLRLIAEKRTSVNDFRKLPLGTQVSITGLAALVLAPPEIQAQVEAGELALSAPAIEEARRAKKEAEEADQRAKEADQRAKEADQRERDVKASVKAQIAAAEAQARLDGEVKLNQATANMRRELEEAKLAAELRLRDVDQAQAQLRAAQAEWQKRLDDATKKATQEERAKLEKNYTERMSDLQGQLDYQRRTAEAARKAADELTERLEHGRESEAIRARWQNTAEVLSGALLQALGRFPSVVDVQEFGAVEWKLLESLRSTLRRTDERLTELATPDATIVDARP